MSEFDRPEACRETDIAIIGLSCRFPGADGPEAFWRNLSDGVESLSRFRTDDLEAAQADPALVRNPHYVPVNGILDGIELFDAGLFDLSPREAEILDPQQRIFLECAWEALVTAGYGGDDRGGAVGVYAGAGMNSYLLNNLYPNGEAMKSSGGFQVMLANDKDFMATRVSYKLNLSGPSMTVQTACSTSLVAVHLACQALLSGECTLALAGGASIRVPQVSGYLYQEGMILSPDGHCRAFDAGARGTVGGNGAGVVLLKRLEEALADGDCIHAVIKGSAVNNDGALKVGYTAPSVEGQEAVITEALAMAEVAPETIGYVEAHGTGTALGDPIEIDALRQAFGAGAPGGKSCAIGSVKTNVGHLDVAAGVAGLIKTLLVLKHQTLPPSLHFEQPNPEIDFENGPFYINTELTPWARGPSPRRAGVSSFGIGGTNAHVILEEAPALEAGSAGRPWQLLPLSARSPSALERASLDLAAHLEEFPDQQPGDVAFTLSKGRKSFGQRRIVVCRSREEASQMLRDRVGLPAGGPKGASRSVAFLFSGQGSQHVGMAEELYRTEPAFRRRFDICADLIGSELGVGLGELLYPSEDSLEVAGHRLNQTAFTQPALFALEYALAGLWREWGVRPGAMIGHSIGEYVAACLAGVFSLEDALALVVARGRLMQSQPRGSMLAVFLSEQEVQPHLGPELDLAAVNGPSLCVISGPTAIIARTQAALSEQGIKGVPLMTSHAFHSRMMEPILEAFEAEVAALSLNPPQIPFVSNLTGTWITAEEATDPRYWAGQLRGTVRFAEGLETLRALPDTALLEVGPGETLTNLARQSENPTELGAVSPTAVSSLRRADDGGSDLESLLTALGRLWQTGVEIDWDGFYADQQRRRVTLPSYPFERARYWVEPTGRAKRSTEDPGKADLDRWFFVPSWKRMPLLRRRSGLRAAPETWLLLLDDCGLGAALAERLEHLGQQVVRVGTGPAYAKLGRRHYNVVPTRKEDFDRLLIDLGRGNLAPARIVHLWPVSDRDGFPSGFERTAHALDLGFYSLLYLAQALEAVLPDQEVEISVVSNAMQDVIGEKLLCPEKACLLGPVRVIPNEFPKLQCRSVDILAPLLKGHDGQVLLDQLIGEITSEPRDMVVALRDGNRWVQCFERCSLEDPGADFLPAAGVEAGGAHELLRDRGVYLITGGLGGMGLVLAEYLAQTVRARLVLVGRSPLPPRERWAELAGAGRSDDPTAQVLAKLLDFERQGAEVMAVPVDVTDRDAMEQLVLDAQARFGMINGVIHAAGVAGGGVIARKTAAATAAVMAPKITGTLVLDSLFKYGQLDFVAASSSLTALIGEFGQVDYCAANAFLDAFACKLRRKGTYAVSINWDAWQKVGMAVNTPVPDGLEALRVQALEQRILPEEGVEAFRRALASALPQVLVSTTDFTHRIEHDNARIRDALMGVAPGAGSGADSAAELHQRPDLAVPYRAPASRHEQTVAKIWQDLLGIEQIGIEDDFLDLGGHSLLATQVLSRIRDGFGLNLSLAKFFQAPTIAALAAAIEAGELGRGEPDEIEELLDEIEDLSEEEVKSRLFA